MIPVTVTITDNGLGYASFALQWMIAALADETFEFTPDFSENFAVLIDSVFLSKTDTRFYYWEEPKPYDTMIQVLEQLLQEMKTRRDRLL